MEIQLRVQRARQKLKMQSFSKMPRSESTFASDFIGITCSIKPRKNRFIQGIVWILKNSRHPISVCTVSSVKHGTIPVLASLNGSDTFTRSVL